MVKMIFTLLMGLVALGINASELRVALLGDSMTWIGGEQCEHERGWTHWFNPMVHADTIALYARSGATWTNTVTTRVAPEAFTGVLDDDNVIYNQAVRLIADSAKTRPDLIIMYAGTNDAWFASRRPGLFAPADSVSPDARPSEVTSLAGSIELVCGMLQRAFPRARMVLVTPPPFTKCPAERQRRVSDIIGTSASRLGLQTVRADLDCPLDPARHTADGVHTNPAGARILASYLFNRIINP